MGRLSSSLVSERRGEGGGDGGGLWGEEPELGVSSERPFGFEGFIVGWDLECLGLWTSSGVSSDSSSVEGADGGDDRGGFGVEESGDVLTGPRFF